jgi:hypothetical protein
LRNIQKERRTEREKTDKEREEEEGETNRRGDNQKERMER